MNARLKKMVTLAATIAVVATALAVTVASASSHEKDAKIAVGRWRTSGPQCWKEIASN